MKWTDLGRRGYEETWRLQERLREARLRAQVDDLLLFVEHPPVITVGKQKDAFNDFLFPTDVLKQQGIEVVESNRGGRLTYHGPGQMVVYFIVSLAHLNVSIKQLVCQIAKATLQVLAHWGVEGNLHEGAPGVWIGKDKAAFIGLHVSRGVTVHGLSLNITRDLEGWKSIIPCGLAHTQVTSLENALGFAPPWTQIRTAFLKAFEAIWGQPISVMDEKVGSSSEVTEVLGERSSTVTAISSVLAFSSGSDFK